MTPIFPGQAVWLYDQLVKHRVNSSHGGLFVCSGTGARASFTETSAPTLGHGDLQDGGLRAASLGGLRKGDVGGISVPRRSWGVWYRNQRAR